MNTTAQGSTHVVAAFLAGVAVIQTLAALRTEHTEKNAIGAAVCMIAFLHYLWMRTASASGQLKLRYSDWIVTCPLLLWELHILTSQSSLSTLTVPVVLVTVMIALGYIAAKSHHRMVLFSVSCVAFVACIAYFLNHAQDNIPLVYAFFGVWALYPVAFLLHSNTMMNILDMVSKGGFGLLVAHTSFKVGLEG